ncbi:GspH/FimT family pseudopilin [Frateuria aurantia]
MPEHAGYSLIESLMVLSIAAVLATLAVPVLAPLLDRWRLQAACSALVQQAAYARSMAISHGRATWLCPSRDHRHCLGSPSWQQGWLVLMAEPNLGTGRLLREQPGFRGMVIHSSQGRPRLRFRPDGGAQGSNLTWTVCSQNQRETQARVIVNNSGRARVERVSGASAPPCTY